MSSLSDTAFGQIQLRLKKSNPMIWQTEFLKNLIDHLETVYINKMLSRALNSPCHISTITKYIYDYLQADWPNQWDFHYYTGSMISGVISSLSQLCADDSIPCLTGTNEHSLAVSALCGWQLYQRAYVIAVTSGMIDEFRGTLYNLKRAQAPGIIVCAETLDSSWFPFQGTIHQDHDGRKVIAAKGIPYICIKDKNELCDKLNELSRLLAEQPGPVFVFADQNVLGSILPSTIEPQLITKPLQIRCDDRRNNTEMAEVMQLLNNDKKRILWQCSHLSEQERDLVYEIARKAGIALVDTLASPGSVSDYHQSQCVNEYIGTLSVYGFNRKVFNYLHSETQLASSEYQSLFFLKSKVDQISSPFSSCKLLNKIHVVQVNYQRKHISPFTDIGIVSRLLPFLQTVLKQLDVTPEVLFYRQEQLARCHQYQDILPADILPKLPMTANYFHTQLGNVIKSMIERDNYSFVGVYDVGRCGVSAIRNIPKTGKGFSGWYGRALMGDALSSLPYLARTSKDNVLAFIGDGARALVPDIEQKIAHEFDKNPNKININITVFYLCNGVLSMIQTYLDRRTASRNVKQVMLLPQQERCISPKLSGSVYRQRIVEFSTEIFDDLLQQPQQINFLDISLSHNSDGDGLSLISEAAWHRLNIA
ncbi:MAG: decarboxylase [Gammaproteobacteria bacterium]|nr:decarboxylase [Gammaproteobacteria bacterium]